MNDLLEALSNIVFGLALIFAAYLAIHFAVDPAGAAQLLFGYVTDGVL